MALFLQPGLALARRSTLSSRSSERRSDDRRRSFRSSLCVSSSARQEKAPRGPAGEPSIHRAAGAHLPPAGVRRALGGRLREPGELVGREGPPEARGVRPGLAPLPGRPLAGGRGRRSEGGARAPRSRRRRLARGAARAPAPGVPRELPARAAARGVAARSGAGRKDPHPEAERPEPSASPDSRGAFPVARNPGELERPVGRYLTPLHLRDTGTPRTTTPSPAR